MILEAVSRDTAPVARVVVSALIIASHCTNVDFL